MGDGPGMSDDCSGESVGMSVGTAVTCTAVGVIVGNRVSLGDEEGVRVESSDFGGMVGEPTSRAAGQKSS